MLWVQALVERQQGPLHWNIFRVRGARGGAAVLGRGSPVVVGVRHLRVQQWGVLGPTVRLQNIGRALCIFSHHGGRVRGVPGASKVFGVIFFFSFSTWSTRLLSSLKAWDLCPMGEESPVSHECGGCFHLVATIPQTPLHNATAACPHGRLVFEAAAVHSHAGPHAAHSEQ